MVRFAVNNSKLSFRSSRFVHRDMEGVSLWPAATKRAPSNLFTPHTEKNTFSLSHSYFSFTHAICS
jgi:hypothetical protein